MAGAARAHYVFFMRRFLPLLLMLAQCSGAPSLYVGTIQPQAGTCDAPSRASLIIHRHAVQFAPSSGVLVLTGALTPEGQVQAELVRAGADKRPYRLVLRAGVTNAAVDGEYTTPRCRYAVHLQPAG